MYDGSTDKLPLSEIGIELPYDLIEWIRMRNYSAALTRILSMNKKNDLLTHFPIILHNANIFNQGTSGETSGDGAHKRSNCQR